ncbi:MAG: acyl-CoA reductase [Limisphaerales bacterium]
MTLPNYYLADLPPEAELSPVMITEACLALKRNRTQYLAVRDTPSILRTLVRTAEDWLSDDYPYRKLALKEGPAHTGFSAHTIATGLDNFFRQLTGENLEALLAQELGPTQRLDAFSASNSDSRTRRLALTTGPELLGHITAGCVPNPAFMAIVLGLLTRSAQFIKCSRGGSYLPRLFLHSIYGSEPKLGACIEIAEWRGGAGGLDQALFAQCDSVTATGSDEAVEAVRRALPPRVRFAGYGHQVSFGYVTREAISGWREKKIIAAAATDVVAWDQLGCLSPHVFYVEDNSVGFALHFAGQLAGELARREAAEPRGRISVETAAHIAARRAIYEVRAAHAPEQTRHWCSPDSTAWTVVYESDARFTLSCLNRFIYVKPVFDAAEALRGADPVRDHTSTVGLAAQEHEMEGLAKQFARWGATRLCPLGQMQNPPLTWRHDGRGLLGDLVRWTDWEQ